MVELSGEDDKFDSSRLRYVNHFATFSPQAVSESPRVKFDKKLKLDFSSFQKELLCQVLEFSKNSDKQEGSLIQLIYSNICAIFYNF